MIIDAHHHVWSLEHGYTWLDVEAMAPIRRDYNADDLRRQLAAAGVERGVLVEAGLCRHEETVAFQRLADATVEIAGVVGFADLRAGFSIDELHVSRKLVGVRDQVQAYEPDFLCAPAVLANLRQVAAAGFAIDLVIRPDQLTAAARAAAAVPDGRFVLDHLAKPPIRDGRVEPWLSDLAVLARCPNVYAKLSGLVTEADPTGWTVDQLRPYVDAALNLFGPERLLWGSDWPVVELAGGYERWLAAARELVPPAYHGDVFGGNAADVYRLADRNSRAGATVTG